MGRILVGTSGWCGLHPRDFVRHYDVVGEPEPNVASIFLKAAGLLRWVHEKTLIRTLQNANKTGGPTNTQE